MTVADTTSPELARVLAKELARHLTDVVICPGSRNSALSLELIARGDVRIHSRIDERCAAFVALGMARVTGRHVGVLTTSGTAVANCLPAMVESKHSHTPLAIISADRPEYLVGTGANQTIEQRGLLGVDTIEIADVADVDKLIDAFSNVSVHINARFAEPLVEGMPARAEKVNKVRVGIHPVDHGDISVDLSKRTLVIAGDEAWRVDGLEDVPTIAEPSAPAPYHPVHPLAASVFSRVQVSAEGYVVNTKPEQIIVVGHPTLHRQVMALLADEDIDIIVLSRTDVVCNPQRRDVRIASRLKTTGAPTKEWLKICDAAAQLAAQAVRDVLAEPDYGFTGLHVAAAVADTLGTGDTLFVGASNPIRDCSFVGMPFDGVDTYTPRGAAGIDGSISQAVGVALAVQAREPDLLRAPRTVALLGDVTFLHDAGGLLTPVHSIAAENLTIVIANDDGGGIFNTLEVGAEEYQPGFEQAFGTAHHVNVADLCHAYGIEHRSVDSIEELIDALNDTIDIPGLNIIEACTTRTTRRALHEQLVQKVSMVN
ncbi:MAG: 2-succinyl-5-enolpyruvyl-6-hydroxy-3-cyclohexene-1-carboxylic-acid synthase [Corynebacterium sp.]|uniref:2-succinyl-5-enolpyruvyl-6-hydroxy-3- cyclohexene-1-carboxylic-acid synthase n=1 Tax=Corynebacterium sp. TaxID=1720 RepID=UPI0026DCA1C1|nr:2-succinyl-5-enolpyruvyl-6-hydroxy-3-cyclohexene-1-carboxylic-acid synthase [Corynebacterium sp.]MDO4761125.1 2-succinyl-5-enolpyruvyl-6-hydroxy-3-cyclohexene-1-carboxylic-acid synthase [Corynebacterium sp.]